MCMSLDCVDTGEHAKSTQYMRQALHLNLVPLDSSEAHFHFYCGLKKKDTKLTISVFYAAPHDQWAVYKNTFKGQMFLRHLNTENVRMLCFPESWLSGLTWNGGRINHPPLRYCILVFQA